MANIKNTNNRIIVDKEESCESPEWMSKIEPFLSNVLKSLDISGWELSVLFCRDSFIHELNKQYRQIDNPTDVLSFENGDEYIDEDDITWFTAGDIVISLDTLKKNTEEFNVSADEELKRLLIHGILHLDGYDHSDNSPEQEMLVLQEKLLPQFLDEKIINDGSILSDIKASR